MIRAKALGINYLFSPASITRKASLKEKFLLLITFWLSRLVNRGHWVCEVWEITVSAEVRIMNPFVFSCNLNVFTFGNHIFFSGEKITPPTPPTPKVRMCPYANLFNRVTFCRRVLCVSSYCSVLQTYISQGPVAPALWILKRTQSSHKVSKKVGLWVNRIQQQSKRHKWSATVCVEL